MVPGGNDNPGNGTGGTTGTGSTGSSGGVVDTGPPPIIWEPANPPLTSPGDCRRILVNHPVVGATSSGGTQQVCFYDPAIGPPGSGAPTRSARDIASDISTRVIPLPGVQTSPPAGADQLVNLPTWLWVDDWNPVSTSASEAGLTVTVTATPASVTWDMGPGQVECGAGVAWNPGLREEQQSSDCTYTYTRSSYDQPDLKYFASATMRWDVTWTASNGESGGLGQSERTTAFRMRVAEGQAVITSSGV